MRKKKHVLLCWEFGSGYGHARRLKLLGDRLADADLEVSFALRRPEIGASAGIPAEAIKPAPNWPMEPAPADHASRLTSATYGDFLAQMLFSPYDDIAERLRRWHALIDAARPDLVIADYAPSVSLLCHGRLPVVAVGNGFVLPPTSLGEFPRLVEGVAIRHEEPEVTAWINDALGPYNRTAITRLPQINRADRTYLLTLPCLDPYRGLRDGGWLGSADTQAIAPGGERSHRLFAYFQERQQTDARLIEGLAAAGLPGMAVFASPLGRTVELLASAGISAPPGLADLARELPRCGVMVHPGSLGMAMAGIAAGVPQVMIKTDLEKTLVAQAIAAKGAGTVLSWKLFGAAELAAAIRNAADDAAMREAARNLCIENGPYLKLDPLGEITRGVMDMLAS
jgi:hypothetical protein